jgi:hypothetical protein
MADRIDAEPKKAGYIPIAWPNMFQNRIGIDRAINQ